MGNLTKEDADRLRRLQNRRGRCKPSSVPARLTRTSAFAPKRRGLITDSSFTRVYIVPKHSAIRVKGRELGAQHRDALYAVFGLKRKKTGTQKIERLGTQPIYTSDTTWRELLTLARKVEHANNVASMLLAYEEINTVSFMVFEEYSHDILEKLKKGKVPDGPAALEKLISCEWEGLKLDDRVRFTYGAWAVDCMEKACLVSLNADVHFELKSDYAKCYWPYIDSMNHHDWVDEEDLCCLLGRDLWGERETANTRSDLRRKTRLAFDDMVRAGGLSEWSEEIRGAGRRKTRRYHYKHKLGQQLTFEMGEQEGNIATEETLKNVHLTARDYEQAKEKAPGWDIYFLESEWRNWMISCQKELPAQPAAAFIGYCKKHYEIHGAP